MYICIGKKSLYATRTNLSIAFRSLYDTRTNLSIAFFFNIYYAQCVPSGPKNVPLHKLYSTETIGSSIVTAREQFTPHAQNMLRYIRQGTLLLNPVYSHFLCLFEGVFYAYTLKHTTSAVDTFYECILYSL